jgi:sulfonate transport system ATP-binding protein
MAPRGDLLIRNVGKQFHVNGAPLTALDNVGLSVAPGEFLTIVGTSGCGKSTLLRLIAGLDMQFRGEVIHDGVRVNGCPYRLRHPSVLTMEAAEPWD